MPRFSCETKACQSEWKNKIKIKLSSQSVFPREYGDHLKKYRTHQYGDHTFISQVSDKCKSTADVWVWTSANRSWVLQKAPYLKGVWGGWFLTFWSLSSADSKTSGLLTGALTTAQCFSYHLGCVDIHVCEEKLMLDTIFWIFSSFFRMLDLTAQILSCWSFINCSSSASSDFRGSTTVSVILRHRQRNGLTQKNETIKAFGYLNHDKDWDALIESYYSWSWR